MPLRTALTLLYCSLLGSCFCTVSSYDINDLTEWFKEEEGYFSPKQEIRPEFPEDPTSRFAVFAKERIEEGELLVEVPWDMVLSSYEEEFDGEDDEEEDLELLSRIPCGTVRNLVDAMQDGESSELAPYVNHLLAQKQNKLPSSWSESAKTLFVDIMGGEGSIELLMNGATNLVDHDWYALCGGERDDTLSRKAALLVQQYGVKKGHYLVPMLDLYPHRNGPFYNTKTVINDDGYNLVARRTIGAGESIHTSINQCDNCDDFDIFYGTPRKYTNTIRISDYIISFTQFLIDFYLNPTERTDLFRDHGFLEQFPQKWMVEEEDIEFDLEEEDGMIKLQIPRESCVFEIEELENGELKIAEVNLGVEVLESQKQMHLLMLGRWFRKKLNRLNRMRNILWAGGRETYDPEMPEHEWHSIMAFYQDYRRALKTVVLDIEEKTQAFRPNAICSASEFLDMNHYDDFKEEDDAVAYNEQICNSSEFFDFRSYEPYATEKSNYQTMQWQHRKKDDDMCLHLDDMLQICSSYRPHYHEFFVHYPARYIDKIRRVIFLGSGDAMLLHEILKYPDLEKVVGLELDQQITRKSFQYFKTQPHYDDDRVEWWYGDATKTLPLLPREYWGTFDLLLVDLSETVVSLGVTGKHDILEVITQLLTPDGIMLENELYIDKLSHHFDHTIQIFYGSPKVCTQVLTVASNKVDFLHDPMYDHGVDAYLLDPIEDKKEPFKYIHDYVKTNAKAQGKCHNVGSTMHATTVEHGRIAGVLQIVEAENAIVSLNAEIQDKIYSVVKKEGLTPISSPSNDDGVVVVAMEEGYVVVRMWPEQKYCAFDINLWGRFEKADQLRTSLVEAVGSSSVSSYRIVVGGMHGSSTREQDQEVIGIEFSQKRNCESHQSASDEISQDTLNQVASEIATLLSSTQLVVAVACGDKDVECPMLDFFSNHPSVENVIPLWTPSDLPQSTDDIPDFSKMFECEKTFVSQIDEALDQGSKLDMVFFDVGATFATFQIVSSILMNPSIKIRAEMLNNQYILVTPFFGRDTLFRRRFLDRYRKLDHPYFLSANTIVLKGGNNGYLGIGTLLAGDEKAVEQFYQLEGRLRKGLPNIEVDVRLITGGKLHPKVDLEYESHTFEPEKYDFRPSQEQFSGQQPLGRQTIFQLRSSAEVLPSFDDLSRLLEQTLAKLEYSPSRFDKFTDVGNGCIIVSIFLQGSAILVWGGSDHVDINLFSFDQSKTIADNFVTKFTELSDNNLKVALRDDQPRGIGRVMSYTSEMENPNYITYGTIDSS